MDFDPVSRKVIGAALEVHRPLGPGLLETAYERCLAYDLSEAGIYVERQKAMPLWYKGVRLGTAYRIDLLVERQVVVEIKAAARLCQSDEAQILHYLKLSDCRIGLLINFGEKYLRDGLRRYVN